MMKSIISAIAVTALSSGVALAQSVSAGFPDTVTQALKDFGHNAETTEDSYGDPMIEANYVDLKYAILFYGCKDNANCQDLQFRASFERGDGTTDEQIFGFNGEWMVGKTYVGTTGSAIIEHPIMGVDGMARASFERTLTRWVSAMEDFYKLLYES